MKQENMIDRFIDFLNDERELSDSTKKDLKEYLLENSSIRVVEKGENVLKEDESADFLYFLDFGSVKVYKKHIDNTDNLILSKYQSKTIIGTSIMESDVYIVSMDALEKTNLLKINRDFMSYILKYENVVYILMKIILFKKNLIVKQIIGMTTKTAKQKILDYFQSCNKRLVEVDDMQMYELDSKLKNYDLAEMLGIRTEVLSRNITELIEADILYKRIGTYYFNRNYQDLLS